MSNKIFFLRNQQETTQNNSVRYRDINMISKDKNNIYYIQDLIDINAINNALNNLFTWIPGERILEPEFGSNLRKLLYEGITIENEQKIIAEIKYNVQKWEPRIQIQNIYNQSSNENYEKNTINLIVVYTIPELTNKQYQYIYTHNIESI